MFLIELIQIKYCFETTTSESESYQQHVQMMIHILKLNNGLTGISISASFEKVGSVTLPDGLPVSSIVLTHMTLLSQMKAIYNKYVLTGASLEINISSEHRQILDVFFKDPQTFIQSIVTDLGSDHNINIVDGRSDTANKITANIFDSATIQLLQILTDAHARFVTKHMYSTLTRKIIRSNRKFGHRNSKNYYNDQKTGTNTSKSSMPSTYTLDPISAYRRIRQEEKHNHEISKTKTVTDVDATYAIGDQWVVQEIIGKGAFGIVHRGTNKFDDKDVALKFIIKDASKYHQQTALNEIKILKQLTKISHPNVIRLDYQDYNYTYSGNNGEEFETVLLVMEYASNGHLFDILRYSGAFNAAIARTYFHRIISALKCFHQHNIIHRDLKPENVLLDSRFNLKICDFGLSIVAPNENSSVNQIGRVGTKGYMAPEILSRHMMHHAIYLALVLFCTIY